MDGKVAIVTGAGRGIGRAAAIELAEAGCSVTLAARTMPELQEAATTVRAIGGTAIIAQTDVSREDDIKRMVQLTVAEFGRIDVLVNNAAMTFRGDLLETSLEDWNRVLATNLTSVFLCAKHAVPHIIEAGGGVVINVSSINAMRGTGHGLAYTACKGAIDAMTYDMAVRLGPHNIRVISLQPGAIDTEISRKYADTFDGADEIERFSKDMTPLGRWGRPEEIGKVIRFLAGDDASFITNTTILADGGWFRQCFPNTLCEHQD
ncbi:MAG: glucose 1-dehydrogenase [Phycisphaerae bacterium]|nr:glucose 1-dehydrogenase [Phycisphaerae bacterium]